MKTVIFLFLLSLSAFAAPVVEVVSSTSVKVDGSDFGKPADAIRNNPQLASPIQLALEKWASDVSAANAAALKAKDEAASKTANDAKVAADAKSASDAAAVKAAAEKAAAAEQEQARLLAVAEAIKSADKIGDAQALAAAATKPKADRELAELKAKKADIEAQIAARESKSAKVK